MLSPSMTSLTPRRPGRRRSLALAALVGGVALVAAACSSAGATRATGQPTGQPAAPAHAAPTPVIKAYVGLFKDNAVAVLDTSTNHVIKTIAVPPGPHGMVITP